MAGAPAGANLVQQVSVGASAESDDNGAVIVIAVGVSLLVCGIAIGALYLWKYPCHADPDSKHANKSSSVVPRPSTQLPEAPPSIPNEMVERTTVVEKITAIEMEGYGDELESALQGFNPP